MKTTLKLVTFLIAACAAATAQVVPEATGPGLPVAGTLNYNFRYAQTVEFGSDLGSWQTANASAEVDYSNGNERLPFSLNYGGGYAWTIQGPSYETGLFQHLLISQGLDWRKWKASVSDNISILPEAPVAGFVGIPGIGEPIGGNGPNPPAGQTILTEHTRVIFNSVIAQISHPISYATTVNFGGAWNLLRFPDGNGLNTNGDTLDGGVNQRLNARNSLTARYTFGDYSYPDYAFTFISNALGVGFNRSWNAKLTSTFSGGPQWTTTSNTAAVPPTTSFAGNATVRYNFRKVAAGLTYSRGATGGSGYLLGAETENVNGNLSRQVGRNGNIGLVGSYMRTTGLQNLGVIDGKYVGAEASWKVGQHLSTFANYTVEVQSTSAALPVNTLTGPPLQMLGFGFGYTPRATHLSH